MTAGDPPAARASDRDALDAQVGALAAVRRIEVLGAGRQRNDAVDQHPDVEVVARFRRRLEDRELARLPTSIPMNTFIGSGIPGSSIPGERLGRDSPGSCGGP